MTVQESIQFRPNERRPQWLNSVGLVGRIIVKGTLVLDTPTHFGSGDNNGLLDMPLMRDTSTGQPVILGSTLAGALRAYLQRSSKDMAEALFGNVDADEDKSCESWVLVVDAHAKKTITTELRDGVGIDSITRTAGARLKYDLELLEAGTEFEIQFELLLPKKHPDFEDAFYQALSGLNGEIHLGKRKRRGFGECHAENWRIWSYRFPTDLVRWLEKPCAESEASSGLPKVISGAKKSEECVIEGVFTLESSLIIRATPSLAQGDVNLPDHESIRSKRENGAKVVIPGTSLAGVLRARCERIANTIRPENGKEWAAKLFGQAIVKGRQQKFSSSRMWVSESVIDQPNEWVHTRVKIDRFTGGVIRGALFSDQVLMPSDRTKIKIRLRLEGAKDYEVGLLLLLLKDLWTGDLPVGGESGVGRGRLKGISAEIQWKGAQWSLTRQGVGGLNISTTSSQSPNDLVNAFKQEVQRVRE